MDVLVNRSTKLFSIAALALLLLLSVVTSANAASAGDDRSRVIITLAVSQPESASEIARTTEDLLTSLPADDYTVVNRPSVLPFLTLSAGVRTMSVLRSNSLVAAIEGDGTVSIAKHEPAKKKKSCKRVKWGKNKKLRICKKVARKKTSSKKAQRS